MSFLDAAKAAYTAASVARGYAVRRAFRAIGRKA